MGNVMVSSLGICTSIGNISERDCIGIILGYGSAFGSALWLALVSLSVRLCLGVDWKVICLDLGWVVTN